MSGIWVPQGGRLRARSKGAFRGRLTCPVCKSGAIRFIENVGMNRSRYRCRKCGLPFQYDYSNNPDWTHPYAALKKNRWQQMVEVYNARQGRKSRRSK